MHVLMIGHAQIKSFQDPNLPSAYDRYQLKINDKVAALVREGCGALRQVQDRARPRRQRNATLSRLEKLLKPRQIHPSN